MMEAPKFSSVNDELELIQLPNLMHIYARPVVSEYRLIFIFKFF